MPLQRLWAGVPLAVLIAVLAHASGLGPSHVPGGDHAAGLLGALAAALVALLASAVVRATICSRPMPLATKLSLGKSAAGLAALAAGAFAAIEFGEGHALSGGGLPPLGAILPLAFVVLGVARHADRLARRAGARIAVILRRRRDRIVAVFVVRSGADVCGDGILEAHHAHGRAPPRFA